MFSPMSRPCKDKARRSTTLSDLPGEVRLLILDGLHGSSLHNAVASTQDFACTVKDSGYASDRLYSKYGKDKAFVVSAFRSDAINDNELSIAPGSTMRLLLDKFECDPFATHPRSGQAAIHFAGMVGNQHLVQHLVGLGENVDRPHPDDDTYRRGYSPLMLAIDMADGQLNPTFQVLLELGASEEYRQPRTGYTALHIAASMTDTSCLQALLARGWNPRVTSSNGTTILMMARTVAMVDVIYAAAPELLDQPRASDGMVPIMRMARCGRSEAIKHMLYLGADVNAQDSSMANAAFYAGTAEVMECLDIAFIDLALTDARGHSPLHSAAMRGACSVIRYLVTQGPTEDYSDFVLTQRTAADGMSPLDLAVSHDKRHAVRVILDLATTRVKESLLLTYAKWDPEEDAMHLPIHVAVESGSDEMVSALLQSHAAAQLSSPIRNGLPASLPLHIVVLDLPAESKVLDTLLDKGADIDALDPAGHSPLYLACHLGMRSMAMRLIGLGADVNGRGAVDTPLYGAVTAAYADLDIVQALVEAGADVEHVPVTAGGANLLHLAATGNPDVLAFLLLQAAPWMLGASCQVEPMGTPLHCAVQALQLECVELLIAAGSSLLSLNADLQTPYDLACECHAANSADGLWFSPYESVVRSLLIAEASMF